MSTIGKSQHPTDPSTELRRRFASWRVVDIVVASVIAVAGGVVFAAWDATAYEPLNNALKGYPPASALLNGVWLIPAVLGGLIIRKPGAAVYTELVAATIEALLGNKWGFSTVWYGLVEGLAAELVFAVVLYRAFGLLVALAAGAAAGLSSGVLDLAFYYPDFSASYKVVYVALATVSGLVIAGVAAWALARALARTGALAPLASGRTERV